MARFRTGSPLELERYVPEKQVVVDFTLTANAASSTLSNNALRPTSAVSWSPITSNAAGALSGMYMSTPTLGQVVLNHANNAQNDKTFRITITNG